MTLWRNWQRPAICALAAALTCLATAAWPAGEIATGPSGLPLPRFVSLKADRINVHVGPAKTYDFSKNMLFDEKIGGTIHLALGSTYPETGGKNESGLHWDMLCDMTQSEILVDGELYYKDGKPVV